MKSVKKSYIWNFFMQLYNNKKSEKFNDEIVEYVEVMENVEISSENLDSQIKGYNKIQEKFENLKELNSIYSISHVAGLNAIYNNIVLNIGEKKMYEYVIYAINITKAVIEKKMTIDDNDFYENVLSALKSAECSLDVDFNEVSQIEYDYIPLIDINDCSKIAVQLLDLLEQLDINNLDIDQEKDLDNIFICLEKQGLII